MLRVLGSRLVARTGMATVSRAWGATASRAASTWQEARAEHSDVVEREVLRESEFVIQRKIYNAHVAELRRKYGDEIVVQEAKIVELQAAERAEIEAARAQREAVLAEQRRERMQKHAASLAAQRAADAEKRAETAQLRAALGELQSELRKKSVREMEAELGAWIGPEQVASINEDRVVEQQPEEELVGARFDLPGDEFLNADAAVEAAEEQEAWAHEQAALDSLENDGTLDVELDVDLAVDVADMMEGADPLDEGASVAAAEAAAGAEGGAPSAPVGEDEMMLTRMFSPSGKAR